MGTQTRPAPVRCIGDPYGVGSDCLAPAVGFAWGAIPNDSGDPVVVAMPFCDAHAILVTAWLSSSSPLDVTTFKIDALPIVQERMRAEGDELWLYRRTA